jgi:hypothetical protein
VKLRQGLGSESYSVKVRFIDLDGKFGYTTLGRFFFADDCMYLISRNRKYQSDHNPDILDFNEELEILKFTRYFIVRVIFAGVLQAITMTREKESIQEMLLV